MRIVVRGAGAVVALVAALLASGCAPSDPQPTPGPSPSATPLFESDEEALAAAEEAYAAYLRVSDQILMDGGTGSERLLEVATEEVLANEEEGYEKARAAGLRSTGGSTFNRLRLQKFDSHQLSVYLCKDVSTVDVVDANGVSVVPEDRPAQYPLSVTFLPPFDGSHSLVVSEVADWDGENFCL
jgi:hypothetical protein